MGSKDSISTKVCCLLRIQYKKIAYHACTFFMLKLIQFLFCCRYEWCAMLVGGWGRVGALLALLLLPASCQEEHPGPAPCQEEHPGHAPCQEEHPGHAPTELHPQPGHAPTDLLPHLLDGVDGSREPRIDSEFFHICLGMDFMRILKSLQIGLTRIRCRNLVERINRRI